MSQRFEERTIPQRTERVLTEVTCDICKKESDRPGAGQWDAQSGYDVSRTTISCEEGTSYPDSYSTETLSFDICPTCFKTELMPFMAHHFGAKPRTSGED